MSCVTVILLMSLSCLVISHMFPFVALSNRVLLSWCQFAVAKQLRGQSVIHQPQLALSTDNTDDIAAADDDGDELDENVIGKY